MKEENKQIFLGVGLVLAGGFLFYLFGAWFFGVFKESDKSVQASILAGSVVVISFILTYLKERSRSIKEAHREKKIEVYTIFNDLVSNSMRMSNSEESAKDEFYKSQDFVTKMYDFKRDLIFYGSPSVINAFSKWNMASASSEEQVSHTKILKGVGDVLLAMRSDIGLSNWGLDNLGIHQINIKENIRQVAKSELSK